MENRPDQREVGFVTDDEVQYGAEEISLEQDLRPELASVSAWIATQTAGQTLEDGTEDDEGSDIGSVDLRTMSNGFKDD